MIGFADWLASHRQDGEAHIYGPPDGCWAILNPEEGVWHWEEEEGGMSPLHRFATQVEAEQALYVWLCRRGRILAPRGPYWVLLCRNGAGGKWHVQFGDYDRRTVAVELREHVANGHRVRDLKIVRVKFDLQAAIDRQVAELNR